MMRKVKILFIGSFLSKKTGTYGVSEIISNNLTAINIESKLISRKTNKILRLFDIIYNLFIFKGDYVHIDVFSGNAFIISEIASFIASIKNKKIILTLHGGNLINFSKNNLFRIHKVLKRASIISTPSKFLQNYFSSINYKVEYLPNPIDISRFPYGRKSVIKNSILWVRAFNPIYNPEIAIYVLEKLKYVFEDVHLTMVGPDKGTMKTIKLLIRSKNLDEYVSIIGAVQNQDLYKYYQSHNVYLNTTSFESFGMAVVEAASSGIPIVSNNVGEIPYIWTNETNILLVEDNNINQYVEQITRIFSDNLLSELISKNAKKTSLEFEANSIISNWVKYLK